MVSRQRDEFVIRYISQFAFRLKKLDFSYVFSIGNNIAVVFYLSLSRDI